MPTGGVSSAGTGLQLQQTFPGKPDHGNFNIDGIGIAGQGIFPGQANVRAETGDHDPNSNNVNTSIGDNQNWTHPAGWNAIVGCIALGSGANIRQNSANQLLGCTTLGVSSEGSENYGVVVGYGSILGGAYTAGQSAGIVLGALSQITNWAGQTLTSGILIGFASYQAIIPYAGFQAYHSVTIGNSIHENISRYNGGGNIFISAQPINATNAPLNCIYINTGKNNAYAGDLLTPANDNSIIIGESSHTAIIIGGRSFTSSGLQVQKIADANATAKATDSDIFYTSITAARTVQLPAANTVEAGHILRVADFSGAASGANSITVSPFAGDSIVGPGTPVITTAYGSDRYLCDGVSKWICSNNF